MTVFSTRFKERNTQVSLFFLIIVVKSKSRYGCAMLRETKTSGYIYLLKTSSPQVPTGHESRKNKVTGQGVFRSYFEISTISNESKFCMLMDLSMQRHTILWKLVRKGGGSMVSDPHIHCLGIFPGGPLDCTYKDMAAWLIRGSC